MGDDIRAAIPTPAPLEAPAARRLVAMQVGQAIVYVEQAGPAVTAEADDLVRPVAALNPQQAFDHAGAIVRECVRVIGERLDAIALNVRPDELSVEFSLSFDVSGRASVVPVFITGETKAQTGLKITARWKRPARGAPEP